MTSLYFPTGIAFLLLAKVRHTIAGYTRPKPFTDWNRCVEYDRQIAQKYADEVSRYAGQDLRGKDILELGPGADLGTGILLLMSGAASYTAVDCNPLAAEVPLEFYERLCPDAAAQLERATYLVSRDFDLGILPDASVDIVLSNAAFEHFDDVPGVLRELTRIVRPGGALISEVDLQTHSRWIREKDPYNIYRYPRWLYRLFYFPGQPNRVRPDEYRHWLDELSWKDVETRGETVNWGHGEGVLSFTLAARH